MMISQKDPDKMSLDELLEEKEMMLDILIQFRENFPFTCRSIEKDLVVIENRIKACL